MIGVSDCGDSANSKKNKGEALKPVIARNATDVQRIRLEKLMKQPDKPVVIPERPKEKSTPHVPEFVRNVMGSSAGAGSGEFHVYRHLRRKEYARQKCIQEKAEKELQDEDYHRKLEENKRLAEERTNKKRAKRLKKKKQGKKMKKGEDFKKDSPESSSDEDDDVGEDEEKEPGEERREAAVAQQKVEDSPNSVEEEEDSCKK